VDYSHVKSVVETESKKENFFHTVDRKIESTLTPSEIYLYNSYKSSYKENRDNVNVITEWWASKNLLYMSILHEEENSPICQFGRIFVMYDVKHNTYYCDCRHVRPRCAHVVIAKLYVNVKEYSIEFRTTTANSNTTNNASLSELEARYLLDKKQYPQELPSYSLEKKDKDFESIKKLEPVETHCAKCHEPLLTKQEYSRSGILLDLTGYYTNIKLYLKRCGTCNIRYFYREFKDGIHLENRTAMTLRLCLYIRAWFAGHLAEKTPEVRVVFDLPLLFFFVGKTYVMHSSFTKAAVKNITTTFFTIPIDTTVGAKI